ncbi:MAG: PLP-dependent lyase/thiolase [Candidatus Aenigmarchaeota archaeon]|nr:PLP-dependent lyase/thiolase [Candidatus Aenigmarchaeota archaeon]
MALTKAEERTLESIVVPSDDDPDMPEFPPDDPHWPSTPTIKISVPGFSQVFLKDESVNPTGTHKDRMAWEMVVTYRQLLMAKRRGRIKKLPQMSIITSGSAANAIQSMLRKYGLPNLKALVDHRMDSGVKKALQRIGCEIFETDLSRKVLHKDDILRLTNNEGGIDITSDKSLQPFNVFYDWMSYDIINQNASYVFVPYGTGHLYENIVNTALKEEKASFHDRRFRGDPDTIRRCNFMGATTNNPNTRADKLYSPYLPFVHFDTGWIRMAIENGYIGSKSNALAVQERYFDIALGIAKKNGVGCEPSGIAGLALMIQMKSQLPRKSKMLIVNTGKTKYAAP